MVSKEQSEINRTAIVWAKVAGFALAISALLSVTVLTGFWGARLTITHSILDSYFQEDTGQFITGVVIENTGRSEASDVYVELSGLQSEIVDVVISGSEGQHSLRVDGDRVTINTVRLPPAASLTIYVLTDGDPGITSEDHTKVVVNYTDQAGESSSENQSARLNSFALIVYSVLVAVFGAGLRFILAVARGRAVSTGPSLPYPKEEV